MIHLKYKCKVNFVKLPLIWIDLCLKLVFEIDAAAATQAAARLWTALVMWASQLTKLMFAIHSVSHKPPAGSVSAVHMRACTGIKNAHNSVTVQNLTHVRKNVLLRITHTIISQSNADSSWITLYKSRDGLLQLCWTDSDSIKIYHLWTAVWRAQVTCVLATIISIKFAFDYSHVFSVLNL